MCGRYTFFTDKEIREIEEIIEQIDNDTKKDKLKTGEIFPSDVVPVLLGEKDGTLKPRLFTWGFPGFQGKQLIINARSETAREKRMFKSALEMKRCVIPSTGFYEWDKEKKKYQFNIPDSSMLYMAGLYNQFDGEDRFVILTTEANKSVEDVHARMPVVLEQMNIRDWLFNEATVDSILLNSKPNLLKTVAMR